MSELSKIAEIERAKQIAKNDYNLATKPYNSSNPDALSDGDNKGKDGVGENVGSKEDIDSRKVQLARNKYSTNNPYGQSSL